MNTSTLDQQLPASGLGLHHKALKYQIANSWRKLKSVLQLILGISHQDLSIGVVIAYNLLKLNSGKADLPACMIAFTINSRGLNGVLLV
jgi:hypothetical protein